MSTDLKRILAQISQHGSAGRIAARHDTARLTKGQYPARVHNHEAFASLIGDFVNRQLLQTGGGTRTPFEARALAKDILTRQGRNHGRTYNNYARDAIDGRNGGLRAALDALTDAIRDQQTLHYIGDVIDRVVDPLDWDHKVAVTGQLLNHYRQLNPNAVEDPRPEVHAQSYDELLRELSHQVDSFTNSLRRH